MHPSTAQDMTAAIVGAVLYFSTPVLAGSGVESGFRSHELFAGGTKAQEDTSNPHGSVAGLQSLRSGREQAEDLTLGSHFPEITSERNDVDGNTPSSALHLLRRSTPRRLERRGKGKKWTPEEREARDRAMAQEHEKTATTTSSPSPDLSKVSADRDLDEKIFPEHKSQEGSRSKTLTSGSSARLRKSEDEVSSRRHHVSMWDLSGFTADPMQKEQSDVHDGKHCPRNPHEGSKSLDIFEVEPTTSSNGDPMLKLTKTGSGGESHSKTVPAAQLDEHQIRPVCSWGCGKHQPRRRSQNFFEATWSALNGYHPPHEIGKQAMNRLKCVMAFYTGYLALSIFPRYPGPEKLPPNRVHIDVPIGLATGPAIDGLAHERATDFAKYFGHRFQFMRIGEVTTSVHKKAHAIPREDIASAIAWQGHTAEDLPPDSRLTLSPLVRSEEMSLGISSDTPTRNIHMLERKKDEEE